MLKKWSKRLKKDERGLTLVELLAVVVILAIVAVIAFILIGNVIENSRKDAHIANAQQLIAAAKLYESNGGTIDSTGVSPSDLEDAGVLGPLTSPWKDFDDYGKNAKVTVTTDNNKKKYIVEIKGNECDINATEANLNSQGRDACNKNLTS